MYRHDKRIVMTLDAGGTNFVFSAIQSYHEVIKPISLSANSNDLERCLNVLLEGFTRVKEQLQETPVAISFAFPGPADYEHGIIGDLPNFPTFRGGIALGPFLKEHFNIPVFINNDGNLFAYGEALAGKLPEINARLEETGSTKRYKNLLGLTLGTGFGAGVVINNQLLTGDNGCGGDVWIMRNKKYPEMIAEEGVSIRAVKRVYQELSKTEASTLSPKDIFDIAEGYIPGNKQAAINSFRELGEMVGHALVNALNIVDGLVVIGGGVSGASKYILPGVIKEMNRSINTFAGNSFSSLQSKVFNLEQEEDTKKFFMDKDTTVLIPFSKKKVPYTNHKKIGIAISTLGTNEAVALGAYTFALAQLDN